MILLADGGSTKTSWCLSGNNQVSRFETEGYNPYFSDTAYIVNSLNSNLPPDPDRETITAVHFYGAGCTPEKSVIVKAALNQVFPNASCTVDSDLLAAARAVLGDKPGFAAILGTGTNTGLYDGSRITFQVDSLGFMMGDEGSGGYMGKKLLADYIRKAMPENLRMQFEETYHLGAAEIINRVYTGAMPNRFCAGFTPFLKEHIEHYYAAGLVRDAFRALFINLVSLYPAYRGEVFNCIGSVGFHFQQQLIPVIREFEMEPGLLVSSPIQGLLEYHLK